MQFKKPKPLSKGDSVAVVSPSWAGPSEFPDVFDFGLKRLKRLGLDVIEFPTTRMSAAELRRNPQLRARNISAAFANPQIKAIFTSIGGDDSVRVLQYLDWSAIRENPKILMGFSDVTTLLAALNLNGLVAFHGPCVMAGLAQIDAYPAWRAHLHDMLFRRTSYVEYRPFERYSEGYPDWSDSDRLGAVAETRRSTKWRWLNGEGTCTGNLFGGCLEVLEMMKGTHFWPAADFWNDRILFLETSEEKPSIGYVKRALRNYGAQGVFECAAGLLFGRARGYSAAEKSELDDAVLDVVLGEFAAADLSIVTNMDFGHTDPQFILPLGIKAQLDFAAHTFRLTESVFSK
jgi:muramoyltetrapeptide carboxypeptidase LdcA involved in peptidoglycan recycling